MKKIILLTLVTSMMIGCSEPQETKSKQRVGCKQERVGRGYSVIIVDSCEYIEKTDDYHVGGDCGVKAGYVAHKGNCRFCAERRKQELELLVKQIKEK